MTRTTRGHGRPINVQRSTFNVQRLTAPTSPATCHLPPATLTLSVPLDASGAIPTSALLTALLTLCHYANTDRAISATLSDALSLHTMRKDTSRPATNGAAK